MTCTFFISLGGDESRWATEVASPDDVTRAIRDAAASWCTGSSSPEVSEGRHRLRASGGTYRDVRVDPGPIVDAWAEEVGATRDRAGRWRLRRLP